MPKNKDKKKRKMENGEKANKRKKPKDQGYST
jgi:hypothetical protein